MLKQIIEGAILAADTPLSVDRIMSLLEGDDVDSEGAGVPARSDVREVLSEIADDCAERGFELKKVATGYRFQVRTELGEWIGKLWEERPPRYTRALLETLALIAYKQPITRGDIEEIRGVQVSTNIIRNLLEILIKVVIFNYFPYFQFLFTLKFSNFPKLCINYYFF